MSTQASVLSDAAHGEPSEAEAAAQAFNSGTELNCRLCNRTIDSGPVLVAENLYCSIECANVAPRDRFPVAAR
jgi:hypothetical protein